MPRIRVLIAMLAAAAVTSAAPAVARYAPPLSDSVSLNFNPGWRFARGHFAPEQTDDSGWQRVSTPHTYHEQTAYFGKKGSRDLGPHTYRKHFTLPAAYAQRTIVLEFEGIRQRGQFYLNGHFLGRYDSGVAPFGFDITPYVRLGPSGNVLHAEIDCSDKDFANGTGMSWFYPGFNPLYGGIGRNVRLHVLGKVHATLPLYSFLETSGVYVYAEDISTERRSARVGVEIEVQNEDRQEQPVVCQAVIVDMQGVRVATLTSNPTSIRAGGRRTIALHQSVSGLEFWQPDYPYLYDVYTVVTAGRRVTDVRKQVTGFRKIEVRGPALYLNNRPLMTMGYTPRSQNEWPAIGNAYPDWLHDYSNRMMVDGNARLVRWMHIMPSPQDVASCDRVGLPQIMPAADLERDSVGREWELRKEIMRDTIIYCRNNPSVILWEAANNVLTREHTGDMIDLRNRWDPHGYRRPMGGRSESPEWVSWMYGVRKESYRLSVDTEFLRDESPRRWWDSWSPPYFHKEGDWRLVDNAGGWNRNQDNMCLIESMVYEQYYRARPGTGPLVCNGGVQIFFADGDSFTRSADTFRRSGGVDGMRIAKDAYGCNRTMWSNTPELWTEGRPSIFLPGHWNYTKDTVKPVYVFVSPGVERVELLLNGKAIPGGKRTNTFLFTFPDVRWQAGTIEAAGYDGSGKEVARVSHETSGDPTTLRLKVIQHPDGLRGDASDLVLIETEVVDRQGRRCPLAQNLVTYRVTGPATWRGGFWEEDVPKYANRDALPVLNGIHRVFIRSTEQAGTIEVSANSAGLKGAAVSIQAHDAGIRDGIASLLPATLKVSLQGNPRYGPDLPPAPAPPAGAFDQQEVGASAGGVPIYGLSTAFPHGATLVRSVRNGAQIYRDRPWKFAGLPAALVGADYLQVANDDASTSAGEGIVFRIGHAGRVYVAYDDGNPRFPLVSSPTGFKRTEDKIVINGRPHTIYRSGPMNGGELTYLGTNDWAEQPPPGVNNYVVFIKAEVDQPPGKP